MDSVTAQLTLYDFAGATCGAKVRMVLAEKAIAFQHRLLDRDAGALRDPAYRRLNPAGVVPTLVLGDGAVLTESTVIMGYLEDAYDGPARLSPSDPLSRARLAWWLKQGDEVLPALGTLTYAVYARRRYLGMSEAEREAGYATIPDMRARQRRRSVVEHGLDAPEVRPALSAFLGLMRQMEAALGAGDWLVGEYSLAECALAPFFHRLDLLGLDALWADDPHVADWWSRLRARRTFAPVFSLVPKHKSAEMAAAGTAARDALMTLLRDCRQRA